MSFSVILDANAGSGRQVLWMGVPACVSTPLLPPKSDRLKLEISTYDAFWAYMEEVR